MEVSITVKRGSKGEGKTYLLMETGKSKGGTYKTFGPEAESADLPKFCKVYVKSTNGK